MSKQHHVIYLPGLGDQRPLAQPGILKFWRLFGISAQFQSIGWADGEAFEPKLKRIINKIDELSAQGTKVSLVGISVGAGAALNAYMQRKEKISGVVFVCGVLKNSKNVNSSYFLKNPAFKDSLLISETAAGKLTNEDKAKMLNMRGLVDNKVLAGDNMIEGVKSKKILAIGHIPAIFVAITFYSPKIAGFLKSRRNRL